MSTTKRNRGRPRGTGLDDSPTLRKVAEMLAADPSRKPTAAIKRALDKPTETAVRRLQGKWKDQGVRYLGTLRPGDRPCPRPHGGRARPTLPARRGRCWRRTGGCRTP
jgi:hypothetical protein